MWVAWLFADPYIIAMETQIPFQYIKNRRAIGLNIEILEAIASESDITFEYRFETGDTILELI